MAPNVKEKHLREMRAHLKTELAGAMRECGYPENVGDHKADDELGELVAEIKGIFSAGLQTEIGRVMDQEVGEVVVVVVVVVVIGSGCATWDLSK